MPELPVLVTWSQFVEICRPTSQRQLIPLYGPLNHHLHVWQINTRPRVAAFLGQVCHESGSMRFLREIWGPTPQQLRYEPGTSLARSLGNTQSGDGHRFLGRGLIQITGRSNYEQVSRALDYDFVADPRALETPEHAVASACWFWATRGLNELADVNTEDAYRRITRRINGGLNGWADRLERWHRILQILAQPAID
jgi:putative chitinase